uniref:Reverse transcriptase domain-containing protein n=1 Tax=Tanacetum cinerariifolium TaxID=118510 RepID=A0A6L2JUQ5_TANCI|nr:reverse transcriptase domain-containing protein [Tanacetum cinerariifolium]
MRTHSSSNLVGESSPNPTTSNLKRRNRRRSKQPFSLKESPLDTIADQRTMAELLCAPTEGYAEAIVVPPILAEHFELKHSLINMMTSDQFFGLEKDNPHDHIAWDRYKDIIRACPHHGFTKLHQLDTFYNALNPAGQDSLNSAAGGNLLERRTQDVLTIIENKSKQTIDVTTAMTVILKQFQATLPPASVKAIEEICVTCGGAHPYYLCLAADGNTFSEFQDNIQGYVSAAAEDERTEETLTDPKLAEYTIKVPPPLDQKGETFRTGNTPLNENCLAVILKKLPEKLGDPGKFLIPCGFSELKCKALADLAILESPSSWEDLSYGPLRHDTSSYSNQPHKESINMIDIYNDSYEDYLEDFFATNHLSGNPTFSSHTDLTSPEVINPLSGNTTSSSPDHLLEEFSDKLALITFPPRNDNLLFDIESDLSDIEYLFNHDPTKEMDSILKDSVDEGNLADPNNDLVATILEMFTDEHTLDCSSLPLYDDVDDDLVELESDNDDVYDDLFDSKGDKIKESKLLIDELDPPRSSDFLPSPECDSVLYEDFSKVDAFPSTNNEDKVFNLGILIHENLFEVTIRVTPDKNVKKISISNASLTLEDFNPSLYELSFHKEVPGSKTLLSFSSKNEEKVFNPSILTSKGVHSSLLLELSHRGPLAFKVIKIFESPMEIFPCSYGEDIRILDVPISQILKTRARGFVLRSLDLHILSFILGIQYPNLID